ncbi:ABC transporter ATP-binding protein [Sulfobacillus harzensis]|uniref:ABC transporter ATP-binding protein n=1 Tax=Sulfobacillus harzensis TaxID=2729629 RepID=A0A7Y0L123_9FIRM|nr:ABC transporter ATP-binding protein [Sulfobacillus harzensis]NMP21338.1 ABC transporter ATP-binding protein [Sulfobacillus harzensis]
MASVLLQHVSKQFGSSNYAVHDVNLDIEDKEFLVLLGPSGCGKTTTLRMVAGLEEVSEGRIVIGGQDVTNVPPKDRDIAMVFQNYALYPHMTVYENMSFGLKLRKMPKTEIDKRVKEAAEILGLSPYLARRPKELSGGQRQRVALGRAIVREPKAFLMDEPLSNLDAKLRTQTRVELKRLHQRLGATIIYVTHDQTEAMTMGTRIVVMRDGVVQQVDTPDGIYHRPANQFVGTFVGTPAMNLLSAELSRQGTEFIAHLGDQTLSLPTQLTGPLESLIEPQVTLGVRPEDVHLVRADASDSLKAVVRLVEAMGHEQLVYLSLGSRDIVARTDNDWTGKSGDAVGITFDMARLHLFDPVSEESLLR